jgi:hypothetical protein
LARKRKTSMAFPRGASSSSWSFHTSKSSNTPTMDITPVFNEVLVKHHARPVEAYVFRVEALEDFVREAYRIVGHVARRESE